MNFGSYKIQNKGVEIEKLLPKDEGSKEKVKLVNKEARLKNLQVVLSILTPALGGIF